MGPTSTSRKLGPGARVALAGELSLVILLLVVSGLPLGGASDRSQTSVALTPTIAPDQRAPPLPPTDTITIQNRTVENLSEFWGVGVSAESGPPSAQGTHEVQGTPITWYEWPAGKLADEYNMTSGLEWLNGFALQIHSNESQFVRWCESVSCHAIIAVPGEIDDPATAAYMVSYTEQVLDFHPALWQIGNEPYGWTHFGIPWANWTGSQASKVDPQTYADVVQNYSIAMHAVDPHLNLSGLPGVGAGKASDTPWINATVALNGPNLSAVAIHDYPAESGGVGASVSAFFKTLGGSTSSFARVTTDEAAVKAACRSICSISFLVDEFNSGTGTLGGWQPYMASYPEIPYVAAETAELMQANVTNADLYDLRSAYNGSLFDATGGARPLDMLYSQILSHVDDTTLTTTVTGGQAGVYADASETLSTNSLALLAVNTNTTLTVRVNVPGPLFPSFGSYSTWLAENSTLNPNGTVVQTTGFGTTSSWMLPPMGVLLVSVCRPDATGSAGNYPVTFCESGLPSGTSWSVTLGGSTLFSTTGTISYLERNGTYPYSVGSISGWRTPPPSGSVVVAGGVATVLVPWTAVPYPVTFSENNLPAGTLWSVEVNGTSYNSTSNTIAISLPNGSYTYRIGGVPGWTTAAFGGSFLVDITPVFVVVNWTRVTYAVTFVESGLPASTNWSIDLNGVNDNSTTTSIGFFEPNGTDPFTVGSVAGYTPDAYSGLASVDALNVTIPITWSAAAYTIQFNETGLAPGTSWYVTLNGTPQGGPASNFSFYEPSGLYSYTLGAVPGWTASPTHNSFHVVSTTVFISVGWTRVTYSVTFEEANLASPYNWTVVLNGSSHTSPIHTIVFSEPNGTYPFQVPGVPGYTPNITSSSVVVNGSAVAINVTFTHTDFGVTFNETGLPVGTSWLINITGHGSHIAYGTSLLIRLPNGTFNYSVFSNNPSYAAYFPYGNRTVLGSPIYVDVAFGVARLVTFSETGLQPGTNWSVGVTDQLVEYSNTTAIPFLEPNGVYNYTVGRISGYTTPTLQGNFTMAGSPVTVPVPWTVKSYPVTFSESGLPSGTSWTAILNGSMNSSSTSTIGFLEPNGTYTWTLGTVSGWTTTDFGGMVTVHGGGAVVDVNWTQVVYTVKFVETGLPASTEWFVTLNGTLLSNTAPSIKTSEPNGSYQYVVGSIHGWLASPLNGTVSVVGGNVTVSVTWTELFTVTFTQTNLSHATNWSVTLGATTNWSSTGDPITFLVPSGVYNYTVSPLSGWIPTPTSGRLTVHSTDIEVAIAWQKLYAVTFTETGLLSGINWSVTVNGREQSSVSSTILFNETNGSYTYTVGIPTGWATTKAGGTVTVIGAPYPVSVPFTGKPSPVTFSESGLPAKLQWQVTVDGMTKSLMTDGGTDSLNWTLVSGAYTYSITPNAGWHQATLPYTGPLEVSGPESEPTLVYFLETYDVTFSESGLASGLNWQVTFGGALKSVTANGGTDNLTFSEPNGTLTYTIGAQPGWTTARWSGSVPVAGSNVVVTVVWAITVYLVTFTETGLPTGTVWSVTLNGVTNHSASDQLTFTEANGSYAYTIGAVVNYDSSSTTGTANVRGSSTSFTVEFNYVTPKVGNGGGHTSGLLGLPASELYEILSGVLVALLIVILAVAWSRRRQGPTATPPPSPPIPPSTP
jgi:hypothetical protein